MEPIKQNPHPLVSVLVITYNSAPYIIETLDSIRNQTYTNIELIVSDDASSDNTIQLCQQWLSNNRDRFKRVEIIESANNTGVSANLNRAFDASQGEWIKDIAGDDLLVTTCIADCIHYIMQNKDTIYLFAKVQVFGSSQHDNATFEQKTFDYSFFSLSPQEQYNHLLNINNPIPAASCFYNRKKVLELGIRNDETIPLLEDWPKWMSVTKKGIKLHFLDKATVKYRISGHSLTTKEVISIRTYQSFLKFYLNYQFPILYNQNPEKALHDIYEKNMLFYTKYYDLNVKYEKITNSTTYILVNTISKISRKIVHIFKK